MTMVVSPLLVLMQNQLEAAENWACAVLSRRTKDRRGDILRALETGRLDLGNL